MLRQLLLLPVFVLLLSGASCSLSPGAFATDGGNNEAPRGDDACSVDQIRAEGEQTCATCDYGTICGVADRAPCEVRENSQGDACQLCITSTGDVLFDDCFIQGEVDSAVCEPSPSSDPTKTCTTCFDALGAAISTSCTPVSDSCVDETIDGRACSVCSRDGEVVSTTCDTADLDPRACVVYGNALGRCVDCFGDDGVVIIHTCSESLESDNGSEAGAEGSPPASCEQRVVDGVSCTVCYDDTGAFLNQSCSDGAPASQRCERLEFTEQVCQVCVDSTNAVTFVDCVDSACSVDTACRSDADCFDNQACYDGVCTARAGDAETPPDPGLVDCPEPPTCEMFNNRDGQLCRACPTSAGATEVRCMSNTSLVCDMVNESELPAATSDSVAEELPGTDAANERNAQGRSCVLCTSPTLNVEVYRDCEGNGAVPPPACVETSTIDGATCTACFDAVTGNTVYSSCAAAAGNDTCYGHSEHVLVDAAGAVLSDDTVACKTCNDGVQTTTCALASVCGDGLTADPSACAGTATLRLTPHQCGNPWQDYRSSFDRDDDLTAVMSWSRAGGVVVQGATAQASLNAATCTTDDCSCARGDVIDVVVAASDRAAAERFFTNAGVL